MSNDLRCAHPSHHGDRDHDGWPLLVYRIMRQEGPTRVYRHRDGGWSFVDAAGRCRHFPPSSGMAFGIRLYDFLAAGEWREVPYVPAPLSAVGSPLDPAAYRRRRWHSGERARRIAALGGTCAWCHSKVRLQLDHVIPVRFDGSSDDANYQVLCNDCNQLKRGLDEWNYGEGRRTWLIEVGLRDRPR